ncbi:MAG: phosphoribosylglycinamide formyltransferase [Alphaproteobacteria bacterium]|nr:phosphoribosylglycinamide formyltransferase [Alphaproteobacteria bacterium]
MADVTFSAPVKVAVLASGSGSNLQALINACATPGFPARIVHVLSNVDGAKALERARAAGIPTSVVSHRQFAEREAFDNAVNEHLREVGAELVCLAGFMRILSEPFVDQWRDRLINIHPSLLPAFKGLHTHERVLAAGVRITGCTVHFVRPAMDEGPIIVQAAVTVLPGDTPDELAARVLDAEHRIYPLALRLVTSGRARVVGEGVEIENYAPEPASLLNPGENT